MQTESTLPWQVFFFVKYGVDTFKVAADGKLLYTADIQCCLLAKTASNGEKKIGEMIA